MAGTLGGGVNIYISFREGILAPGHLEGTPGGYRVNLGFSCSVGSWEQCKGNM